MTPVSKYLWETLRQYLVNVVLISNKVQSNPVISRAVNSRQSVSRACTLDPKF